MKEKLYIEELVRSKLGQAELDPSPGTWKRIRRRVRWKQFIRFRPGRFNIFYAGGVVLLTTGVILQLNREALENKVYTTGEEQPPERIELVMQPEQATTSDKEVTGTVNGETGNSSVDPSDADAASETTGIMDENPEPGSVEESEPMIKGDGGEPEDQMEPPVQGTLLSYFTASVHSGCAPLSVRFFNQSVNGASVSWDFGTGERSSEENPLYIFREPGRFKVTLTVENAAGEPDLCSQVIEVLPSPQADFEIDEGLGGTDGVEQLNLINYSSGACFYAWDITGNNPENAGGWSASEIQPVIMLEEVDQDARFVRLIATNESGCSDTAVKAIPEVAGRIDPTLRFPTAFSPNTSGPSGGYYSPHEKRNDIFYPLFESVPKAYRMRIYTRRGELVFETENIHRGWDGYYQQERSAGDVYIWMAEGRWENGREFMLQGDVTLIWGDGR